MKDQDIFFHATWMRIFVVFLYVLAYIFVCAAIKPRSTQSVSTLSFNDESSDELGTGLQVALRLRGGGVWDVQTEQGFDGLLEKAGKKDLVVVDFSAAWCGPCKMIAPAFDELSNEYPDSYFVKVDVDQVKAIARRYEVMSMPTFILFKNGKVVERFSGASIEKLRDMVIANL